MIDKILAVLSIAGLAAFLLVVVVNVGEIDLSIVIIGVLALAAFDFWVTFRNKPDSDTGNET